MKKLILLLAFIFCASSLQAQTNLWGGLSATQGKSFLSLGNVENTALSTWAGTANITILGTIATGTWSATTIAINKGGTGNTTYTDGQLLIGNTSGNTLTKATLTGTSNQVVVTNGNGSITLSTPQDIAVASTPTFAGVTSKLSDGGTTTIINQFTATHNSSGTPAAGFGVASLYQGKTSTTTDRNLGAQNFSWSTATEGSQVSKYALQLVNGNNTLADVFTVSGSGVANVPSGGKYQIAATDVLTNNTLGSGVLASSLTSVGTLTGGATGAGFTVALTTSTVTGTLTVPNGGTGIGSATAYSVICGGTTSTGAFQNVSGLGTSGYVLTSNGAGALPTWQAASGGGFTYSTLTADLNPAVVNNAYITNKAGSQCVVTLPTTASVGQQFQIIGYASNGWKVAQNASQKIYFGTTTSTTGTGGYVSSNDQYDVITIVCIVANNEFTITSATGNITVF